MRKKAEEILQKAGYALREGDSALIEMCAAFVEAELLADSNLRELPPELTGVGALHTAGAFLAVKQNFIPEDLKNFSAGEAVKRLKLGDTDVEFSETARETAKGNMASLIEGLLSAGKDVVACRRQIRW